MRSTRSLLLVPLLVGTACTETAVSRFGSAPPTNRTLRAIPPPAGSVVILLPLSSRIVAFDPETTKISDVLDLEGSELRGIVDSAVVGRRLIVTGAAPGSLGSIDLETGRVSTRGRFGEVGVFAGATAAGPDGTLHVVGSTGEPLFAGVAYEIDPRTLEVLSEVSLPAKQVIQASLVAPDGTVLSLASEEGVGRAGLTVIAPGEDPVIRPIRGGPQRLALGPSGRPLVTRYSKNSVVEVDPAGGITRAVRGVGTAPKGIDVSPGGTGVVAAEGAPGTAGTVHFIDFNRMEIIESVSVDRCKAPREVVIVGDRAVVGCLGPPSVLVYDLESRDMVSFKSLWDWTDKKWTKPFGDEPRGFTLIPG